MALTSDYITGAASLTGTPSIAFKHGTQANLNSLRESKGAAKGTFYLTRDTHRLYVGVDGGDAVPVNEGITLLTYAEFEALNGTSSQANAGQFVYITDKNILAVSTGSANGWVQINAVKDTTYTLTDGYEADSDGNGVTATFTLNAFNGGTQGSSQKAIFKLEGANGVKVLEGTTDGDIIVYGTKLSAKVADGTATIGLKSHGAGENDAFDSSVQIKQGTNVQVSGSGNVITVSATDSTLKSGSGSNEADGFKVTMTDTSNASASATIKPRITLGTHTGTDEQIKFENGIANLPVYTKDEIDAKYLNFNAMTYKGVLDEAITTLPSSGAITGTFPEGVKNGDTYIAGAIITSPVSAQKGDLVIATGVENATTGLITTVTWQVVESANEDTQYTFTADGNGLIFKEKPIGSDPRTVASLKINGDGEHITVAKDATSSGNNVVLEVQHNLVNRDDNPNTVAEQDARTINVSGFNAADFVQHTATVQVLDGDGVVTDNAGHVTGTQEVKWLIKDTNARLASDSTSVAATSNKATITHTATLQQSGGGTHSKSSSFAITGAANTNISITKGSGAEVKIDLVWGTFGDS